MFETISATSILSLMFIGFLWVGRARPVTCHRCHQEFQPGAGLHEEIDLGGSRFHCSTERLFTCTACLKPGERARGYTD